MASSATSTPLNPGGDVLPIMVHVTAPATLPAGYTFEAELNGDPALVFNCEVVRLLFLFIVAKQSYQIMRCPNRRSMKTHTYSPVSLNYIARRRYRRRPNVLDAIAVNL
jgi:hypothetical protein